MRVLAYALLDKEQERTLRLVGPAYFGPHAESHRGLCHGGSFCSVMDDAIGQQQCCSAKLLYALMQNIMTSLTH